MPLPGRFELALVLEAFGLLVSINPTPIAPQDTPTEHLSVLVLRQDRSLVLRVSFNILPFRNRAPATRTADQELFLGGNLPAQNALPSTADTGRLQNLDRMVTL